MQVKPIRTSYSALDTFGQCPLKYKFQQIDKIKVPKSKEQVFGNKVHKALQFFHSKQPTSPTLDELLNYLKEMWPARHASPQGEAGRESEVFQSEQEDMIYFGEAVKILKNYYNHYLKIRDRFTVLDTEIRFEVLLRSPEKETCVLAGIIDRIDKTKDNIEVIDYKTTKRLPSQQDIDANLQLSLYCLGLINRWPRFAERGLENIKLTFYYLKHQELISTRRTRQQLDKVQEQIWERLAAIEKSDFPPISSVLCDWCGYQRICPMWKHLYREQLTMDDEKAKKVVDEFFELKQNNTENNKRLSELKKIIERYLNKEKLERIFGEVGYITRLSQIREGGYDIKKLEEIIKTLPYQVRKQIEKAKKKDKKYTILKASVKKVKKKEEKK